MLQAERVLSRLADRSPMWSPLLDFRGTIFDDAGVGAVIGAVVSSLQVVSSTRIVLFVRFSSNPPDGRQPLKLVAIDTGAGAVQLNPEDGGVVIGTLISVPPRKSSGPSRHREARTQHMSASTNCRDWFL